jgi:hypothetical protein
VEPKPPSSRKPKGAGPDWPRVPLTRAELAGRPPREITRIKLAEARARGGPGPVAAGLPAEMPPANRPDLWGPLMWRALFLRALDYPTEEVGTGERLWLAGYANRIPCGPCRVGFAAWVTANPPPLPGTREQYFRWAVKARNAEAKARGKPAVKVRTAIAWAREEGPHA